QRPTNNAGGLEAGMTNGQPLIVRAAKKPISTLRKPLESINLETKEPEAASYERSDVCAVSAASVIVENVVAFEIARALIEKFGGDSLVEMKARWELFQKMAQERCCSVTACLQGATGFASALFRVPLALPVHCNPGCLGRLH